MIKKSIADLLESGCPAMFHDGDEDKHNLCDVVIVDKSIHFIPCKSHFNAYSVSFGYAKYVTLNEYNSKTLEEIATMKGTLLRFNKKGELK